MSKSKKQTPTLAEQLKAAVLASGMTPYRIAKSAGITSPVLTRFMNGKRDLRLETAGLIAEVLGLTLQPIRKPKEGK